MQVLDTRPQAAIPETQFRCAFVPLKQDGTTGASFDLYGTIPAAPQGHQPNDKFPLMLGSGTDSAFAGSAMVNPIEASPWFRDYQISRQVGTAQYVINLKLRREGASVAYVTVYDSAWGEPSDKSEGEPYRYDAVGHCATNFSPSVQKQ
ncbi:MAG: hypothetical protein HC843_10965 [Sphingomonadales bacterium]|nr:hypothetical protein [Sphingomonadales bacterium]